MPNCNPGKQHDWQSWSHMKYCTNCGLKVFFRGDDGGIHHMEYD